MPVTQALNSKANVKKTTNQDLPFATQQPVMNSYYATSTAGQTVINLSFSVDTVNGSDQFFLFIDGKKMRLGASNDYQFTSIGSDGTSSQVTMNSGLPINLNIQAYKLGLKSEVEFGVDNRFTQLYEAEGNAFQGFVSQNLLMTATSTAGTPAAGTFHSTVLNRASMVDLSQNLRAHMGNDRIMTEQIIRLPNEFGSANEAVFSVLNDTFGQIRFVGAWSNDNGGNAGPSVAGGVTTTAYVEITFYGTGLNMFISGNGLAYDLRASVDGGAEGSNLQSATLSQVLATRGVATNTPVPVVSNLTLGVHTVRIRGNTAGNAFRINGFEIMNESGLVKVNPGVGYIQGKKYTTAAQSSFAYNANATGVRGGRVVVYQNGDGTIGRAWQATNTSQANLTSADHTNEDIIRTHYFREFAAGRSDDFSVNGGPFTKAFTLDDGTTTLIGVSVDIGISSGRDALRLGTLTGYVSITFVGTGLDVIRYDENVAADTLAVSVDGTSVGNLSTTGVLAERRQTIVSGLPYGTHIVRITNSVLGSGRSYFNNFIIYGPKKPSIPSGAIELADYNVMADFVANTAPGQDTIATGVLRKNLSQREAAYVNGTGGTSDWAIDSPAFRATTDRVNAYVEATIFGTGFEIRQQAQNNQSNNLVITLNGIAATTTNFPTMASSAYGTGVAFNAATGIGDFLDAASTTGAGIRISNLPLAKYSVRLLNGTAGQFTRSEILDIITPIHVPKYNDLANVQNTLASGSQGISDIRKTTAVKETLPSGKTWAQAIGITSGPTTTSNVFVPMPDMSVTLRTNGGPIRIEWEADISNSSASGGVQIQPYVNGFPVGQVVSITQAVAATVQLYSSVVKVPVPAGVHNIQLMWLALVTGTNTAISNRRILLVEET